MLHAIYHNKGCLHIRYFGHRDGLEGKVHEEDEITSAILGMQEFLDTQSVWNIWKAIVGEDIKPTGMDEPPTSFTLELWPKNNRIEPDAMLTFNWDNNRKRHLLMEFKWNSGQSGGDQLTKQWYDFLSPEQRAEAIHLYIAKDISPAQAHRNESADWRIYPITWLELRNQLRNLSGSGNLATYKQLIDRFLEKVGIHPFGGFSRLPTISDWPSEHPDHVFFIRFNGFSALPKIQNPVTNDHRPVFFDSNARS